MSEKYPIHKIGDPVPADKQICNVIICVDCGTEYLLGQTTKGRRPDCYCKTIIRKYTTLIERGNRHA